MRKLRRALVLLVGVSVHPRLNRSIFHNTDNRAISLPSRFSDSKRYERARSCKRFIAMHETVLCTSRKGGRVFVYLLGRAPDHSSGKYGNSVGLAGIKSIAGACRHELWQYSGRFRHL